MTQCERILNHLTAGETITPLIALHEYGVMRLASRINDLKNEGYNIQVTIKRSINNKKYAEYKLVN